jgi:hypothetical protein
MVERLTQDKLNAEGLLEDAHTEIKVLKEDLETAQLELQLVQEEKEMSHAEMIENLPANQQEVANLVETNKKLTDALRRLRDAMTAVLFFVTISNPYIS